MDPQWIAILFFLSLVACQPEGKIYRSELLSTHAMLGHGYTHDYIEYLCLVKLNEAYKGL